VRIGTRGSALALAQAGEVARALGPDAELVPITTSGDRGAPGGDKERWVKELELALLAGEIDIAVHSAKDVPAALPDGLELIGAPRRADPRDALCGPGSLDEIAPRARVGTSSLRRAAQLRAARDDLDVVAMRGNVDTRLRKLADGDYDAIVLALAGLERLGRATEATAVLDPELFVPAAGQGTLALEARTDDEAVRARVEPLLDRETMVSLTAERALVRALEADCHTPVGAHATIAHDGRLSLTAFVGAADGSAWVRDRLDGHDPEALGAEVARRLLSAGASSVLGR